MRLPLSASTSQNSSFSNRRVCCRVVQLALLTVAVLGLVPHAAFALGPEEQIVREIIRPERFPALELSYYDVVGRTVRELRVSMHENGPADHDGTKRYAYFSWWLSWSWPESRLHPVIDPKYRLVLPRLHSDVPARLANEWERFFRALVTHELVHIENAVRHEELLRESLRAAARDNPSYDSSQLNGVGQSVLNLLREADRSFDLATENGKKQGVRLRE